MNNNIKYKKQYKITVNNHNYFFDFCVFLNNNIFYFIEFDGIQHFIAKNGGWNTKEHLKNTQERDRIKNQWCQENSISLIRIPYNQLDNLNIKDLQLETSNFIYIMEEVK